MQGNTIMNNTEPKIFVINTNELWKQGFYEQSNFNISDGRDSISLAKKAIYINQGNTAVNLDVQDFAIDECDTFYILTKNSKLVLFDKGLSTYTYIDCIDLTNAQNIAVTRTNVYILTAEKTNTDPIKYNYFLTCYARANYQIRWINNLDEISNSILIKCITADKDDTVYVFTEDKQLYLYTNSTHISTPLTNPNNAIDISISVEGYLYYLYEDNNKCKIDIIRISDQNLLRTIILPLPNNIGNTNKLKLVVNKKGYIYIITDNDEIIIIKEEERFVAGGIYITKVLDSRIPGCQWHRMIVDMDILDHTGKIDNSITDNTRVEISFFASDDKPSPDITGSNIDWSQSLINPTDALILEAKGRYICFRMALFGDDQRRYSPCINTLSVEFPHHSYLRYLPAVYQEDAEGREFLSRFLPLFESFLSSTEQKIFTSRKYYDADGAPNEFLQWLAQWLSISYDENWSYDKLRVLIKQAPQLYKMRGTREGLEKLLNIYLGKREVSFVSNSTCFESNNALKNKYTSFEDTSVIIRENFQINQCIIGNDMDLGTVTISDDVLDFYADEFICSYSIERLCEVIQADNNDLSITATMNTIAWLNQILIINKLYDKIISKYLYKLPSKRLLSQKKLFDNDTQNIDLLKQLNRLLLEEYYPEVTPKRNCDHNSITLIFDKIPSGLSCGDILKIEIANKNLYSEIINICGKKINIRIINTICDTGGVSGGLKVSKISVEEILYGDSPYSFHVLLKPFGMSRDEFKAVRKLVEREKPAHTEACVRWLEPVINLGMPTYLGINTMISEPVFAVVGEGILSKDTVLSDREPSGQSDVRGRIDIDTTLT